jgi:hexokinase
VFEKNGESELLLSVLSEITKLERNQIYYMEKAERFFGAHKLRAIDVNMDNLVESFTSEMLKGLNGEKSSLRMIPTYIEAENEFLKETPVVAIDAGGTNFRAALVKFTSRGKLEIVQVLSGLMPGLDREVSKKEFFEVMSGHIRQMAEKAERIGFCFSYPTEIFPDKDGRLLQFCKEVQAPEVIGQIIGKSLLEALGTPEKKIVLLNDTVATLLAGKSASFTKTYDSYIGYILGTGTNTCYIEANGNILKNPELGKDKSMIINVESGNFGKAPRTDLDISFDNSTMNPGDYTFEKMFSGGYFGGLCLYVLKTAAKEGLFSARASVELNKIVELTAEEANSFVANISSKENALTKCLTGEEDKKISSYIIDNLINRTARLVAANLAAVVLKTGKGTSPGRPVLITVEGTTFYKLHNLKTRIEKYFSEFLSGERKRYVEFTQVEQSSLIGAALAGLID